MEDHASIPTVDLLAFRDRGTVIRFRPESWGGQDQGHKTDRRDRASTCLEERAPAYVSTPRGCRLRGFAITVSRPPELPPQYYANGL